MAGHQLLGSERANHKLDQEFKILLRVSVTIDRVWIGNQIYWTLTLITTNN
jgi:hypothetical protein